MEPLLLLYKEHKSIIADFMNSLTAIHYNVYEVLPFSSQR